MIEQLGPFEEVVQVHRLLRVMRAVLVAHEDHRCGYTSVGEDRSVVAGSARHRVTGEAETGGEDLQPLDPALVHPRRSGVGPTVEAELHPPCLTDGAAFGLSQLIEVLQRLCALAAYLEAEADL